MPHHHSSHQPSSVPTLVRRLSYTAVVAAGAALSCVGLLSLLQDKLIYLPRHYTRDMGASFNEHTYYQQLLYHPFVRPFAYKTSLSGIQNAFLVNPHNDIHTVRPAASNDNNKQHSTGKHRIWVLTGGNAMLALDWMPTLLQYYKTESTSAGNGNGNKNVAF